MNFDEWLIARLTAYGVYSAARDGGHGRAVINALKAFQTKYDLPVTGTATTATVNLLRQEAKSSVTLYHAAPLTPVEPVWLREARRFMGLKEITGTKSNATIMGWAKKLGGWIETFYNNDDIPWCGLFMANMIATVLPSEVLPSNPLSALAWGKLGTKLTVPALGAILTFRRDGGGHVAFYLGEDATHYHVLGANQSNSVSITRIDKGRLDAIRWPLTGDPPNSGVVRLSSTAGVPISKNEA